MSKFTFCMLCNFNSSIMMPNNNNSHDDNMKLGCGYACGVRILKTGMWGWGEGVYLSGRALA